MNGMLTGIRHQALLGVSLVAGGESLQATFDRVRQGLDRLHEGYAGSGTVVIVTHGEIVRLLTVGLLAAPLEHLFRLRGRNGAVTIFDYDREVATFECVNDASHLFELAPKDLVDDAMRP